MVDFKRLAQRANEVMKRRGGPKSVQEDAGELMDIAKGGGSMSDKAKAAAAALKEPGAYRDSPPAQPERARPGQTEQSPPAPPEQAPPAQPERQT